MKKAPPSVPRANVRIHVRGTFTRIPRALAVMTTRVLPTPTKYPVKTPWKRKSREPPIRMRK